MSTSLCGICGAMQWPGHVCDSMAATEPEHKPCKLCPALEMALKSRDDEIRDLRRRLEYLLGEEL